MAFDKDELRKLQWSIMEHVSACSILPLMRIGDELNLFFHLAENGPCSSKAFAQIAGVDERYAREWLYAMCDASYCCHDEKFQNFQEHEHFQTKHMQRYPCKSLFCKDLAMIGQLR